MVLNVSRWRETSSSAKRTATTLSGSQLHDYRQQFTLGCTAMTGTQLLCLHVPWEGPAAARGCYCSDGLMASAGIPVCICSNALTAPDRWDGGTARVDGNSRNM